ncbi:MAG: pyridoxamine 5'-phosphate oxidase family protein [Thermodesulfobacteriota bacterium]
MLASRVQLGVLAACVAGALLVPAAAHAQEIPAATREALETSKLIYVATQRKSGERSEAAPIWFIYEDGVVYTTTSPDSWKAKRIARGSPLYIWVGSEEGPFVVGRAERITDPTVVEHMGEAYSDKYWIASLGLFRPRASRVSEGKTIAYRVTLSEGTPPPAPRE